MAAVMYRATVARITSDGVFVNVPQLAVGHEFGPLQYSGDSGTWAVGDNVLVGNVGTYKEDLVLITGQFEDPVVGITAISDSATIDLALIGTTLSATVKPNSIPLDDLSDTTIISAAEGQILYNNGFGWLNSSTLDLIAAATTDDVITSKLAADTQKRVIINGDGKIEWGAGGVTAPDVNLYRSSANQLATDDAFVAVSDIYSFANVNGAGGVTVQAFGAAQPRIKLNTGATGITFSDGTNAADTNVYRASADNLKTDDFFQAAGGFSAKGVEIDPLGAASGNHLRHNGTKFVVATDNAIGIPGEIRMWAGFVAPSGWQLCDGSSLSRTTFATLFDAIAPSLGTATITIASPGVVTCNGHGLVAGDRVFFTTTGALPTGLSANTVYFVQAAGLTTNAFRLSTTLGGADINTSGSQSGTHTLRRGPWGIPSSTNFNVPDLRGKVVVGRNSVETEFDNLGETGGAKTHTLTAAQIPAHTHPYSKGSTGTVSHSGGGTPNFAVAGGATFTFADAGTVDNNTGGGGAHNILQPYAVMQYIIKT